MICFIRHWKLKEGVTESDWLKHWSAGTKDLLENHNSLGAVMHKAADGTFWVYARWPDKETCEQAQKSRGDEWNNEPFVDNIEMIELQLLDDQLKQ